MRVSYQWLKELVNLKDIDFAKLVHDIGLYSVEVDGTDHIASGSNIVVGYVKSRVPHENSDHLSVCQVDIGSEVLQVVCGAPNVAAGQHVMLALPGAVLPGGTIKVSSIRGVESNGMICSLQEIGLDSKYIPEEFAHGIYVLPEDAPLGVDALEYLGYRDQIIELGLTPNRMDLMSMFGVANDVNAIYAQGLKEVANPLNEAEKSADSELSLEVRTNKCLAYYARVIKNVTIKESPQFIKERLIASGIRPINNVVDITNYILMLFGQPLHAFDQALLGSKIIVRNATMNEETTSLDEQKRLLTPEDIVITNEQGIVAIGGIMGCSNTSITNQTKDIVLEAAIFDPKSVRKTSTRLGLRSESSVRFERGVDLNQTKLALDFAAAMLNEYADGTVLKGVVSNNPQLIPDRAIEISADLISKYLGIPVSNEQVMAVFNRLGFKTQLQGATLVVSVPNRRLDITIPQDLVEEYARINGYECLKETLPQTSIPAALTEHQHKCRLVKHFFRDNGFSEALTYTLVSEKQAFEFNFWRVQPTTAIRLMHPMSEERALLRGGLLASLLDAVEYNHARKLTDLSIFEIGKRYFVGEFGRLNEELCLSGCVTGERSSKKWLGVSGQVDFYDLKGLLDSLFNLLSVKVTYRTMQASISEMHPYRSCEIMCNNRVIGYLGAIHPRYAHDHDLENVYVFEILLDQILKQEVQPIHFTPIPKALKVERDLALLVPVDDPIGPIIASIYASDKERITNVEVFDVYSGNQVASDKKSVAVRIKIECNETATDEIINGIIDKVLRRLEHCHNVKLRF